MDPTDTASRRHPFRKAVPRPATPRLTLAGATAATVITILSLQSHAARARDLIATRPGLMCRSVDALAKLTLPDGSARTATRHGRDDDVLKSTGGCVDFDAGTRVTAVSENVGNSLVNCLIGGVENQFTVPNADFKPADAPAQVATEAAPPRVDPPVDPPVDPTPPPVPAAEQSTEANAGAATPDAPSEASPDPQSPTSVSGNEAPDVTGLALGMTQADAESTLGGSFAFKPVRELTDQGIAELRAASTDHRNQYLLSFVDDRLWFVSHLMVFRTSKRPDMAGLVPQLSTKYGQPTRSNTARKDGYHAEWQYDADNQLRTAPSGRCTADALPFSPAEPQTVPQPPEPQARFNSGCPIQVAVDALASKQDPKRMDQFQVIMTNPDVMYHHLQQRRGDAGDTRQAGNSSL